MKAFVIYVKNHTKSESYSKLVLDSCKDKGFEAELFEGVTKHNLSSYEDKYDFKRIIPSRANDFYGQNIDLFKTKKSVFYNGYRLWNKCVELDQPIVVLEHDSVCVREWDNLEFDELLVLNGQSCWNQPVFDHVWLRHIKPQYFNPINEYDSKILWYKFKNYFYGSYMIPGAAAYAITPKGAKRLIEKTHELGWEQNDHFINTKSIRIQVAGKEYFSFHSENLNMSHGY